MLREFDRALNGRGVTCVRYIDDFLLLAPSKKAAEKALVTGLRMLTALNLEAYSPGWVRKGFWKNGSYDTAAMDRSRTQWQHRSKTARS